MDYKEKYEQALKRAKELLEGMDKGDYFASNGDIENIFPELKEKESEDERIRKEIIDFVKSKGGFKGDWLAWLEKQDSQNSVPIDKAVNFLNKQLINDNDEITGEPFINFQNHGAFKETFISFFKEKMFEKQSENKPTDNVEIKFCEGDKVVSNQDGKVYTVGTAYYVIGDGEDICLHDTDGNHLWTNRDDLNNDYHLWSINDAKDGDVLVNWNNTTFIFKAIEDETVQFHIAYNEEWNTIKIPSTKLSHLGLPEPDFGFHPATKEQRDLLFQKMKEAGYEWDSEKKELKKIEPKKLDADKVIAWLVGNTSDFEYYVNLFKEDFGL